MEKKLHLPQTGFLRLSAVLDFIPVGRSNWLAGVKDGKYPPKYKLSNGITAWRVEDIRDYIQSRKPAE